MRIREVTDMAEIYPLLTKLQGYISAIDPVKHAKKPEE